MPDNNNGGIPKSITLGGVEYILADHPELRTLVEAGRKEEKDKLYSQIKTLESSITVLKDEAKASGGQSQKDKDELKKLQDELAVVKADLEKAGKETTPATPPVNKGGKDDKPDEKPVGMTAEEVQKIVAGALKTQEEKHSKELEQVRGTITIKDVADHRKEMLEKHKGLLIEDLVPDGLGTKEDVNKAVEKALQTSKDFIRKEYKGEDDKTEMLTLAEIEARETAKQQTATPPANGQQGVYVPAGAPPAPPAGNGNLSGKELIKDLKTMSPADYEKNREAIRAEILKVGINDGKQ